LCVHYLDFLADADNSLPDMARSAISTTLLRPATIRWWKRPNEPAVEREDLEAMGIMLMRMDVKLDRILEVLEDDDGWEEEEAED